MKLITAFAIAVGIALLSWGWWHYQPRKKTAVLILRLRFADGHSTVVLQEKNMRKISSSVSYFIVSIAALTAAGLSAAVDGAISVVTSDSNVLRVEPRADGTFQVTVTGVGTADLTVSGDADLGDGVRTIEQVFEFEVYDVAGEADHFDLAISETTLKDTIADSDATEVAESAAEV